MSWLTNLLKNNKDGKDENGDAVKVIRAYISLEYFMMRILLIDETGTPKKIILWKEIPTGPYENLEIGKPVKDLPATVMKILTEQFDVLKDAASVSVSLPTDGIFYKTVEVSKMKEEEMRRLVLAEVKSSLPIDFSQVLYAQNDLGEKHEAHQSYFCVSIQKNFFESMKTVFSKFSMNPYFEIEVFSLARIPVRDDKYKLIVFVSKQNTYLIFLQGQIIQEVVTHDMGDESITNRIIENTGFKYTDVLLLREKHGDLRDEGRMGAGILDQFVKDFNTKLGKVVSLSILNFEKRFNCEVKDMLIVGADSNQKLQKVIHDEFDAELNVEMLSDEFFDQFVAEDFASSDVKRFAQCFGLAKRAQ